MSQPSRAIASPAPRVTRSAPAAMRAANGPRKPARPDAVVVGGRSLSDTGTLSAAGHGVRTNSALAARAARPAPAIEKVEHGATGLADRAAFDAYSVHETRLASKKPTVKFMIMGTDTPTPKLWFIDGNGMKYHYDFVCKSLKLAEPGDAGAAAFEADTYWSAERKNVAGYLIAHDQVVDLLTPNSQGAFAFEFWESVPMTKDEVICTYTSLLRAAPFLKGKLAYHPASDVQEELAVRYAKALKTADGPVPVVTTNDLFKNVKYEAYNPGMGVGYLRFVAAKDVSVPVSIRDVCIYEESPPNDKSRAAGTGTAKGQNPMSHVNLKCEQDNEPNAYINGAYTNPKYRALEGKLVKYVVPEDGSPATIVPATKAEVLAFRKAVRPPKVHVSRRNLAQTEIQPLVGGKMGAAERAAYGGKSIGIGILYDEFKGVAGVGVPGKPGFRIPDAMYDAFMKSKCLKDAAGKAISPYEYAKEMMKDDAFADDDKIEKEEARTKIRDEKLKAFRKMLREAPVPPAIEKAINALQAKFPKGVGIRCRSSGMEDKQDFNGAGLHDSFTHNKDEGALINTIKQVWASAWNLRAYDECTLWRIDHLNKGMAVTVHRNTPNEKSNGVIITKNERDWPSVAFNCQWGDDLVTNPEPGSISEQVIVKAAGRNGEFVVQRVQKTNRNGGKQVHTNAQYVEMAKLALRASDRFAKEQGKVWNDPTYTGQDMEFKMLDHDLDGKKLQKDLIWFKQSRPVVRKPFE